MERLEAAEHEKATIGARFDAVKAMCRDTPRIRNDYDEGWAAALNRVDDLLDGAE